MTYYDLAKIKNEVSIVDGDLDLVLTQFGEQSDKEIDDMVYPFVTAVPISPAPEILKIASIKRSVAYYWLYEHNTKLYEEYMDISNKKVAEYLDLLKKTGETTRATQFFSKTAGTGPGT